MLRLIVDPINGESMSEMTIFRQRMFQTVDASGFVDLFHAINVRFTSVISVYAHLSPFQFLQEGTASPKSRARLESM